MGELDETNPDSWFRRHETGTNIDPTANCLLQVLLTKKDEQLWDEMDLATFEAIKLMAGEGNKVEWWHQPQNSDGSSLPGGWKDELPDQKSIRLPGVVHEASILRLGSGNNCPVDEDYRVKGVGNVVSLGIFEPSFLCFS